jgi:hypothetical protein
MLDYVLAADMNSSCAGVLACYFVRVWLALPAGDGLVLWDVVPVAVPGMLCSSVARICWWWVAVTQPHAGLRAGGRWRTHPVQVGHTTKKSLLVVWRLTSALE